MPPEIVFLYRKTFQGVPLKIYYDSNTGKISSVQCLSLDLGECSDYYGYVCVTSAVTKSFSYSLSADKYSVTFNLGGKIGVDFWEFPGVPANKVTQLRSFTISATERPHTP